VSEFLPSLVGLFALAFSGPDCPVRVATAENSWAIYKEMAARAAALIPGASQWRFDGVGHCVAQEAPELLLQALAAFEAETA
jgi:pimeloyl-ACP methyl ester carboxylesterase